MTAIVVELCRRIALLFPQDKQDAPEERHQFALAQSADQLQIEHRQDTSDVGCVQVGFQMLGQERLHFYFL
ncbi:MAG: hypothetical protein HFF50_05930 [Lawsonibacter sp.]|nr:hypothetical protein [Lawsonibacter sp.]